MNVNDAMNILNLSGTVTKKEVSKAYKKASLKYHPDRNPAGQEMMKAINEAYDFLNKQSDSITMDGDFKAYDYGDVLNNILNELLKMDGLELELCGNWIWITGNTKENKEKIKELGCRYASKKKAWYFRPEEYKSRNRKNFSMDQVRDLHGSTTIKGVNKSNRKQLVA